MAYFNLSITETYTLKNLLININEREEIAEGRKNNAID